MLQQPRKNRPRVALNPAIMPDGQPGQPLPDDGICSAAYEPKSPAPAAVLMTERCKANRSIVPVDVARRSGCHAHGRVLVACLGDDVNHD